MLRDEDRKFLKEKFEKMLENRVRLLLFTSEDSEYSRLTESLLKEVEKLSEKIELEVYDINSEDAKIRNVIHVPTTILTDENDELDSRVRFLGIPSGYEFTTLVKDILFISTHHLEIMNSTIRELEKIENDLRIEIFVTPNCPHCPRAVMLAHQFAMVSEKITSEMINAVEFPSLAEKWNIRSVPHTVVKNENLGNVVRFTGAFPENYVLNLVLEADNGKEISLG